MTWLERFLVETPSGLTLQSAEFGLRGPLPVWLAALLLAAAVAVIAWLYRHERGRAGRTRRTLLAALRVAAFALVLLLLMRPSLLAHFQGERPRAVVLLVDDSQSMNQRDRRLNDADRIRYA